MRRLYLRDCAPGDLIEDVFSFSGKQFSAGSNGKNYIKGFLGDKSASLTARMWNATRQTFEALPDGGFMRVRARVENYQSNLQVIIEQCWPAKDGTYELADLMPHTTREIPAMCRRLYEMLGSIRNRHLAAVVQAYLDDESLMNNVCRAPAAQGFHHAFLGGLLEHTLNAMEVASAAAPFYPGLNRDLCVAGIFLHDIAKTWELTYDAAFGYSDGGHLVGHIVKSAMWVEEKAKAAGAALGEPIPRPLIDVLQHIILSHHGELSHGFGSAKSPATPEALFVHTIENLDAKMMMSLGATRGPTAGPGADGNWTEYMKAFGGRLYRPDVALPDDLGNDGDAPPAPGPSAAVVVPPAPVMRLAITNPMFEAAPARNG